MAINTVYNDYFRHAEIVNDIIEGDLRIKAQGTKYVPMLEGQDKKSYTSYINRPSLTEYTKRVKNGLLGLAMMNDAQVEAKGLEDILENADMAGNNILDFAEDSLDKLMCSGRVGFLVTMAGSTAGMTIAEAEALNMRPKLVQYSSESILKVKYSTVNNKTILSFIILSEQRDISTDEFEEEYETVYRVLSLRDGIYVSRLFDEAEVLLEPEIVPLMNGKPFNYIPFFGLNTNTTSLYPAIPILFSLANKNITHFKLDVDLYHGLHFTALPTPYVSGYQAGENEVISLGSMTFKTFPDPATKMDFLEFRGEGLRAIEREKEVVKDAMVALGSNILQGQKNTAEAEETVKMRSIGSNATLSSMVKSLSRTIEKALVVCAEWSNVQTDVVFEMNTNYDTSSMSPGEVNSIVSAWLSGAISDQEKFRKLKDGEVIEADKTYEEHQTEIKESAPAVI